MAKNALIVALALLVLVLGVFVFHQQRQLRGLLTGISGLGEVDPALHPPASGPERPNRPRAADSRDSENVDPLSSVLDEEMGEAVPMEGEVPEEEAADFSGFAKMMRSPEMKEVMRAQQSMVMDQFYGELFRGLDLQGQDMDTLKGLLLDKMSGGMDDAMALLDPDTTPSAREELTARIQQVQEDVDEQIRVLLGDEGYEAYKQFEDTQAERFQVDLFKQALPAGEPMTWEQEHELILAMTDERKQFNFAMPAGEDLQMQMGPLAPEQVDRVVEEMARLHEGYVGRAAEILTPGQLATYETSLERMRTMQQTQMKIMGRMMGQGPLRPETTP